MESWGRCVVKEDTSKKPLGVLDMGRATVKIQLMPNSPDADLAPIKKKAEQTIKSLHKEALVRIEEQPIAFGLKAIILSFTWNDDLSSDELENKLREIKMLVP